jgi:hypothetical protein
MHGIGGDLQSLLPRCHALDRGVRPLFLGRVIEVLTGYQLACDRSLACPYVCVSEAFRRYLYISTVTCVSLDRWHQNGNGKGGVKTAVRGRTGIRSDQMEAFERRKARSGSV